jgi:glucan phosphoethanolaminetransferase (alkaline phosphatase superfamily)
VIVLIALHVLASAAAEGVFVWQFGHHPRVIATHALLLAEWDVALLAALSLVGAFSVRARDWQGLAFRMLLAITCTLQVFLCALSAISNASWGRNMTGNLVVAFAPTVWSGKEPFPLGPLGITLVAVGTLVLMMLLFSIQRPRINHAVGRWRAVGATVTIVILFGATLHWGIASRDDLFWKHELIASFFRPQGYAFEPNAHREAVAARDAALRAAYPRHVPGARRSHVVLIIVDSLRADRMQVYGYHRPTTPFLAHLVESGRMKQVGAAFASCPESFCGITSTLASREFRDISARTFQIQDVLRDQGYQTWFLLSGNHRAWNGLPQFYRSSEETFFDGSKTERYTMDDDRLVLEGLERVAPASPERPTFFYIHLMSPHYLGVQFPESHVFNSQHVSPGLEPYKILEKLNSPDRYDDKVRQVDNVIRQLFDALTAKRYLDDAIVVVTGDHGEGLGERHWAHGWHLYNEDIRIPLLLYDTSSPSYSDLSFGTQIDIAPTILDRLGLPIPSSWQGRSLAAPPRRRFTYHQTYFVPNRFAVMYRNDRVLFKFIATPQYGTEELYDLTADRGEVRNLVTERLELAAVLRERVRVYRDDTP